MGTPQVHPPRPSFAAGGEQQREVVEALRNGGRIYPAKGGLYELFFPGTNLRLTSQPDRYITVVRSTVRALIANGFLQYDQGRNLILTQKGRDANVSRKKQAFT